MKNKIFVLTPEVNCIRGNSINSSTETRRIIDDRYKQMTLFPALASSIYSPIENNARAMPRVTYRGCTMEIFYFLRFRQKCKLMVSIMALGFLIIILLRKIASDTQCHGDIRDLSVKEFNFRVSGQE